MTTNHIDQLREWWETAEVGDPKDGDVIIEWAGDGHAVRTFLEAERDDLYAACTYRILARAPKPKPAWHDAVAVIAHTARFSERRPFALTHTEDVLDPYNTEWITRDDLLDPAPLIEAKVTDEMVKRAEDWYTHSSVLNDPVEDVLGILTVALGLETE